MAIDLKGPWLHSQIGEFLATGTLPVRLACVAADGFPRVVSLWYQYMDESLYCVTHRSSQLVRLLERNPKVGFEVSADAPPYCGVRGQGIASMAPLGDSATLENMLSRYVGGLSSGFARWLLSRSDEELLIVIEPIRMFSWDYRERMAEVSR